MSMPALVYNFENVTIFSRIILIADVQSQVKVVGNHMASTKTAMHPTSVLLRRSTGD